MQRDLFENTPVPRAYLKLAVPVVLSMILNVVYNMVDTWFISLTGDTNLVAGVSICSPVFVLGWSHTAKLMLYCNPSHLLPRQQVHAACLAHGHANTVTGG